MLELGSYIRDCKSCKFSVRQIPMLLNVLGKETPKLLPQQVKDINLAPAKKISNPEKEEKGEALTHLPWN